MIITISGTPKSGKTEVAKSLAEKIDLDVFSVEGDIIREIAAKRGMNVEEYYKTYADKIDQHLDKWQKDICSFMDGFVLDSLLGFHWSKDSPVKTFNVFLKCDKDILAKRLANGGGVKNMVKDRLLERLSQEEMFTVENYRKKYGIDNFHNPDNFDMVVDTTDLTVEKITGILLEQIRPILNEEGGWFEELLKNYPEVSDNKKCIYVSSPHVTGIRYYEAIKKNGLKFLDTDKNSNKVLQEIIKKNEKDTERFVRDAHEKFDKDIVVSSLNAGYFSNIQQRQGLAMWRKFIRKYVSKLVLNDGWEYSNGCVEELYLALKEGKEVRDSRFKPIVLKEALYKIEKAIREVKKMGLSCGKLEFFCGEINKDLPKLISKNTKTN